MLAKLLSACLLLSAVNAAAASDEGFIDSLKPGFVVAGDNRYKLVEKKAEHRLELHKALRDYSKEVKKAAGKLRDAMHDNFYEDWINTRLLPLIFEAESARELIDKTVDMEKNNVKLDLKAAKAGNYAPIELTMTRMAAFESTYEAKVKEIDAKVDAVRQEYLHHHGLAKQALARFNGITLVRELLAAKPVIVKHIALAPASMRPLVWRIELVKEKKEYNDPRFGQLPTRISVIDAEAVHYYQVIVR